MKNPDTSLYFIAGSDDFHEDDFLHIVERALSGGVSIFQLREKEKTAREYLSLAKKVHEICLKFSVPLIIDDRLDIAIASEAEGVHLGQSDLPISEARKILAPDKIIGATAKTVPQALEAEAQGADYLGVGAIFPTTTKVKTVLTSTDTLRDICNAVKIPVNAIGGLNCGNLDILSGIPISGVCAVTAILKAPDPESAAKELKEKFYSFKEV